MNKRYVIALDLDDTLLNYEKKVSPKTKKILTELEKKGNIIIVVSGRIFDTCYETVSKLDFVRYMITDSGSIIYDKKENKIISKKELKKETIKKLLDLYNDDMEYVEFSDEHYYYKYSKEKIEHYGLSKDIENIQEFIKNHHAFHSTIKLKNYDHNKQLMNIIENDLGLHTFEMKNNNSDIKWIEIVRKDVSKYQAIKTVAKKEKISINNIISFGDNYNDLDMLKKSKYGVAMGNAIEEVKKEAKLVTKSCNEDGIAVFLRSFFKNDRV